MSKNDPHILGKESIGKLLLQYSIPAIIGMTITSIYNIIDSIFIGHGVGPMAIAGLAVSFPLMNLVVAFCTLVSAGSSTIASIRLGQKDMKGATEILSHTLMLCITNSLFFGILSFIFLDDILTFFGASESRHAPIRTQLYASDSAGNSDHLYDDRFEQCDACYRISEEGDAYFDGNGSSQYHPRSHLYISF